MIAAVRAFVTEWFIVYRWGQTLTVVGDGVCFHLAKQNARYRNSVYYFYCLFHCWYGNLKYVNSVEKCWSYVINILCTYVCIHISVKVYICWSVINMDLLGQ